MANKEQVRWNARYLEQMTQHRDPLPFLVALDDILPWRGKAIDVAGGSRARRTSRVAARQFGDCLAPHSDLRRWSPSFTIHLPGLRSSVPFSHPLSLERRRMTKMPPDGYPALQYLQSVRVSKYLRQRVQ